jgi:ParB family chromosome partitioning protein
MTESQTIELQERHDEDQFELAWVDPRTVELGPNVRSDAIDTLDPDFVDSIRKHGLFSPAALQWTERSTLRVEKGQRRTLGAIKAGLAVYPVLIRRNTISDLDLLTEQFHENDMRAEITDTDRTAGWAQMELFGATVDEIAERTKAPKARVEAALRVSKSEAARAAQQAHGLTIEQSLGVDEFAGDDAAIEKLTSVATSNPGQFAHTLQKLRDERKRAAAKAGARAALAKAGIKEITDWYKEVGTSKTAKEVSDLTADGERLSPDAHLACPGRAAYVAFPTYEDKPRLTHVCLDYKAYGHGLVSNIEKDRRTPEEKEAARVERARNRKNYKDWRSAEKVRRAWLSQFAKREFDKRSTAPKGTDVYIATANVLDVDDLRRADEKGHRLAAEWLGIKTNGWGTTHNTIVDMIAKAPNILRAQHIGLIVLLAATEARTDIHTWQSTARQRYFTALKAWGYDLSPVEQLAAGMTPADTEADEPDVDDAPPVDERDVDDVDDVDETEGDVEPDQVDDDAHPTGAEQPDDGLDGVILSVQPATTAVSTEGLAGAILQEVKRKQEQELAASADAPQAED